MTTTITIPEKEAALSASGYVTKLRDPSLKAEQPGKYMVADATNDDPERYIIVGDERSLLVTEAYQHLIVSGKAKAVQLFSKDLYEKEFEPLINKLVEAAKVHNASFLLHTIIANDKDEKTYSAMLVQKAFNDGGIDETHEICGSILSGKAKTLALRDSDLKNLDLGKLLGGEGGYEE